jgi:hypothetical protein
VKFHFSTQPTLGACVRFFIPLFIQFLFLVVSVNAIGQNISWEKPYAGNDPSLLYYPDQNAVYFRYGWKNNKEQGIVIKGKMPEARYFSFNLYNDYTKGSIAALADFEIVPDADDRSSYSIHIMPEHKAGKYQNQIILPDSVEFASVFLRYYLPGNNIYANKPLPIIYFFDNNLLKPALPGIPMVPMSAADMAKLKNLIMANPQIISGKERKLLSSSSATMQEKEPIISKVMTMPVFKHYSDPQAIGSFNYHSSGNYPNKDNHYIVMPVVRKKEDVLVVRFKGPTHATQLGDTSKNVRYYSLSQGNEYTNTSITMHDEQLKLNNDGFVYVVVAKDTKEARDKATELGINFMPWMYKDRLVLILRHMLPSPGFKQSTREVPLFDNRKPVKGQEAQHTIGDFALVGKFISKSAWKSFTRIEQAGF